MQERGYREVRVAINIDSIFSIDVQKQTWTVAFTAIYEWNDPTLGNYKCASDVVWDRHFVPDVQFDGAHEISDAIVSPRIHDFPTCTAKLTMRFKGEFTAAVMLNHYPFDIHLFCLSLKPRKYGHADLPDHLRVVKLVHFETNRVGSANRTHKLKKSGLKTVPDFEVFLLKDAGVQDVGKNRTDYTLRLVVIRRAGHIITNVVLFIFMIHALAFTAFWLDPLEELSDRLQVVLTLLLTIVAFKLMIKEELPSVPYMTDLDKYMLSSTVALFGQSFMHLIPVQMMSKAFDDECMKVTFAFFVIQNVWGLGMYFAGRQHREAILTSSSSGLTGKRRRLSDFFVS